MTTNIENLPMPPGDLGLPLIGETLTFSRSVFNFIEARMAEHGPIFKTRVLGKKTILFAGPEIWPFWLDESLVTRDRGMFPHVFEIFGGVSLPSMDGAAHRARKRQVMGAFDRAALEAYLPALEGAMTDALARWSGRPIEGVASLRQLAIEGIARNMIGVAPGPETEALVADYLAVTSGLGAAPIKLPGTTFQRALRGRDSVLAFIRGVIVERRARPTGDGLSRMLAVTDAAGGGISDDDAALELHHVFLAGYIVYAELVGIVLQLTAHPAIREALAAEVAGEGPLTVGGLHQMSLLDRFVMEVKRTTPVLPLIQARARISFECLGYQIPAGWQLCVALTHGNMMPDGFDDPTRFDPARFGPGREEHARTPHAFVPQAGGDIMQHHRCGGQDYSTWFMKAFTVLLLRGYTWSLPAQDLAYDVTRIPPDPRSGLRLTLTPRP